MMEFLGIYFGEAGRMWLVPFFIIAAFLLIRNFLINKRAVSLLVAESHIKLFLKYYSSLRQKLKIFCWMIALIFLFLAMLRPQWGNVDEKVMQEGRDILIALDVSRSMAAHDLKPSRLEFAKLKIQSLLKKLKFDRVGLILFSGSAFVYCPITSDYSAFSTFLNNVAIEPNSSGSTSIGSAIDVALNHFANMHDKKNKILVLLTDGEDFSINLSDIKSKAASEGMIVCAIGVGTTEGAPIPILDAAGNQTGYEMDKEKKPILSKLNEQVLEQITSDLNGKYVRISFNDFDIDTIASFVDKFEKENLGARKISSLKERYSYFLSITFLALMVEWIL